MCLVGGVEANGRLPVRVRIGVTGHRTLADPLAVRSRVHEALAWINSQVVSTTDEVVHFTVVTSLAEGADRLVAEAVLACPGAELEAPLPLEPSDYETDFESADSRRAFRQLLKRSKHEVVSAAPRDIAYEEAGKFIVETVDIMIAVWDHQRSRGPGGTARVVRYAKRRRVPLVIIDSRRPDKITFPRMTAEVTYYNKQQFRPDRFEVANDRARQQLLPKHSAGPLHRSVTMTADWIIPFHVRADLAALRFQRLYYHLGTATFLLAATAVTVAAGQAIIEPETHAWLWLEVACIATGLGLVILGTRLKVSERWLAYRSLAERFRSALYLAAVGVREVSEVAIEGNDLGDRSETWVVQAAREVWMTRPRARVRADDLNALRSLLLTEWIADQIEYYDRARIRCEKHEHRVRRGVILIVLLVLVLAALHAASIAASPWLTVATVALPVFAAAVTGIAEQREYRRMARRYDQMTQNLKNVQLKIEQADSLRDLQAAALIGDATIREERQDWFGTMLLKDLQVTP